MNAADDSALRAELDAWHERHPDADRSTTSIDGNGGGAEIAARLIANAPPPPAPDVCQFVDWSTFWTKDRSEPEWVVENVLARRRGHAIWARGGNGKSEFVQWVALRALEAGHVVIYLDYEMIEDDLFDRMTDFGCGPETDLSRFWYVLIPTLRPMDRPEGAADLAVVIDHVQAKFPDRHVVVIIDTIGRAVVGEENSNDTVMNFYRYSGAVLKARGTTWARLDHTGHEGEHARGGSAKRDDVDIVWKHERTDSGCRLFADKRRANWIPESVSFDRHETPNLRYEPVPWSWPAGTVETATLLDRLAIPLDASSRTAQAALKEAGHGRRRVVVNAAIKYRAQRAGTTPGTTLAGSGGNQPGTTPTISHNQGAEPPPEPPGTTTAGHVGTTGVPPMGTTGPRPTDPGAEDWREMVPEGEL